MWANLDFSWLTGATLSSYILKGFLFSVQLTLIATRILEGT